MILSDKSIRRALIFNEININPLPDDVSFQPSSVDLRLGSEFKVLNMKDDIIDPLEDKIEYTSIDCDGEPYFLAPGSSVLATTVEKIRLGNKVAARVEGRSSLGRIFLNIHSTAGFIDPGFNGQITLEITNLNQYHEIALHPEMKICQIVFERLEKECERPYGHEELNSKYQNQKGVVGSRFIGGA